RPTTKLPFAHLARISAYWLGLTAIDAAVGQVVNNRILFEGWVPDLEVGRTTALVGVGGAIVGIIIQPTVGAISDYTVSRWGRRKPYIVIGSLLDVLFLLGIAYSNSLLAIAAFVILLSFSTNIARGPFQGYVPDLVPERQVGLASAMVGLMQILGNVIGFGLASFAASATAAERKLALLEGRPAADYLPLALMAIAVIELVTMVSVVRKVREGQPPRPREGRSWRRIAREAWATDILKERSYVYLVASRLFFLMGGGILVNLALTYLKFTHRLDQEAANQVFFAMLALVIVGNLIAIVPAARISDRIGRKPVIYAACAIGAVGILIVALAPSIELALVGGGIFGASAGMFLSVDWALMTDIIPKAAAGRYMGLSNVATGAATPLSLFIGGFTIDLVNTAAGSLDLGPRVAYLLGVVLYGVAVILFRPVVEPPRATPVLPI
ncbi:MAG TPA: MFS transporter, partial [Candidatus Limnocylindrales bacterium]|nr:MFS transporter [Candidatus Limnocylindrales bacterium]